MFNLTSELFLFIFQLLLFKLRVVSYNDTLVRLLILQYLLQYFLHFFLLILHANLVTLQLSTQILHFFMLLLLFLIIQNRENLTLSSTLTYLIYIVFLFRNNLKFDLVGIFSLNVFFEYISNFTIIFQNVLPILFTQDIALNICFALI